MPSDIFASHIAHSLNGSGTTTTAELLAVFRHPDGRPDPLRCGELLVDGRDNAEHVLRVALRLRGVSDPHTLRGTARAVVDEVIAWQPSLTGAEAVAVLLAAAGVTDVFVYAGTSELAMCDAVDRVGGVRVVNGRGDKESAFMAAGACLLKPNVAAAILHGARGLTNAAGAVADARRNEAGTMFVVGMPSTGSARFLPPHGEANLCTAMSAFADWCWEAPAVPAAPADRRRAAKRFVSQFRHGLQSAGESPTRPAIFGIPQDVAERSWIGIDELAAVPGRPQVTDLEQPAMSTALRELARAERPLFLVDDYALRYDGIRPALDRLSRAVGGAVLQLRYRRGPMLFERLRTDEVANFVGWLNQFSTEHMDLLRSCDLLVTVEDRNMYERVVGQLPGCRKLAVNTDPEKVLKNEYLADGDALVIGDPAEILAELADRLPAAVSGTRAGGAPERWYPSEASEGCRVTPEPASDEVEYGRRALVRTLAGALAGWHNPVLLDDSQMFGGLLSEHYEEFPPGLRVFGGHGGFVGGGLALATGLAISCPDVRVMCTLGDQAFTNSFQGLVSAIQERARVLFVVCNNGESVSLKKQAAASYQPHDRSYLSNVDGLRYHELATALGLPAWRLPVPVGAPAEQVDAATGRLTEALTQAAAVDGPALIELVLPSDPEVWRGIWLTQGFEQLAAVTA